MNGREFLTYLFIAAIVFFVFTFIMPIVGTDPVWLFAVFMILSAVIYLIVKYLVGGGKKEAKGPKTN